MNGKDLKPEKANKIYGQRNWVGFIGFDQFIENQLMVSSVPVARYMQRENTLRLVCVNGKRIA